MRARAHAPAGSSQGFTLLELMIVVSILAILASVGVPGYLGALRTARVGKAKHELRTISTAIDSYTAVNEGKLPLSLYQVGFGGRRDPWGTPYCYLNYADGTGDGLEWAIEAGVVDPSAFDTVKTADATTERLSAPSTTGGGGDGGLGVAVPQDTVRIDYAAMKAKLGRDLTITETTTLVTAIDLEPTLAFFTGVEVEPTRRRDRYMFPLNTDYDLFSLGPDHATAASLGESVGHDDVIRANNGGYFGVASNY